MLSLLLGEGYCDAAFKLGCLQRLFSSSMVQLITTDRHVCLVVSLLIQVAVHLERH